MTEPNRDALRRKSVIIVVIAGVAVALMSSGLVPSLGEWHAFFRGVFIGLGAFGLAVLAFDAWQRRQ